MLVQMENIKGICSDEQLKKTEYSHKGEQFTLV